MKTSILSNRILSLRKSSTVAEKQGLSFLSLIIILIVFSAIQINKVNAQQRIEAIGNNADTAAFHPATLQGQNLDLAAVLAVFQESKGLEDFEQKINSEDGVNNLDLNGDSLVDYIRVMEKEEGEYRVIILQSIIGENEFQDVAYINILKRSDEDYDVQAEGNERIYGKNYYVSPQREVIHVHHWPVWSYIYVPHYHYYNSPYYWGYYPRWYNRYYYRHYDYYYGRVYVYHTGYYYHSYVRIHRPVHIYRGRSSNYVRTTPPAPSVVGNRPNRPNSTVNAPRGREAKPGEPVNANQQSVESRKVNDRSATSTRPGEPRQRATQGNAPARNSQASSSKPARQQQAKPVEPTKSKSSVGSKSQPRQTKSQPRVQQSKPKPEATKPSKPTAPTRSSTPAKTESKNTRSGR